MQAGKVVSLVSLWILTCSKGTMSSSNTDWKSPPGALHTNKEKCHHLEREDHGFWAYPLKREGKSDISKNVNFGINPLEALHTQIRENVII
jgi:hypothetical protein